MLSPSKSVGMAFMLCLVFAGGNCSCDCDEPVVVSRGLCAEFRDLKELIPMTTFLLITSRHYQHDAKFRQAMKFLQTVEFDEITKDIECSAEYLQLLVQFETAGVDTADIALISDLLDCLLLPVPPELVRNSTYCSESRMAARSVQTYATEVMQAIPRRQFRDVLAKNLASNPQFAKFYKIVRSSEFKRQVLSGLASPRLAAPLDVLKRNFIDVRRLFITVMKVLTWGP